MTLSSTLPDGTTVWDGTYTAPNGTAHFKISLSAEQGSKENQTIGFGRGRFIAVPGSQAAPLVEALRIALEAKHSASHIKRVTELAFTYASLGSELHRMENGSFDQSKPGHWTAYKLFFASPGDDDEAEVFLNLNPVSQKGEFTIKDSDYGDEVLQQLATVL